MLLNRREDVYQIIRTIGTEKGVEKSAYIINRKHFIFIAAFRSK